MKNKYLMTNISEIRKGCKDNFHAFMVNGATFDGYYDMPVVPKIEYASPKKLIAYDKINNYEFIQGDYIHFYLDDQKFDGPRGIWSGISNDQSFKKGFNLDKIAGCEGIITPDFSLYLDMPRVMQIWNVYRSRAIGYYLTKLGFNVIPNIRWTDSESYKFAFDGIVEGSIVAVGTLGCAKCNSDKELFVNGFIEMIKRIKPAKVMIYGTILAELQYVIDRYNVEYVQFDSDISTYYRGENYGNEI